MSRTTLAAPPSEAGTIVFEVRHGIRRVSCSVSDDALEAVSGLTTPSTALSRRRSFDRFRTLINTAAQIKLDALSPASSGQIVLNREDLRRVPPQTGTPSFGTAARISAPRAIGSAA